jgi:DNA-binding MurR/RpiR family transcriptional regulator
MSSPGPEGCLPLLRQTLDSLRDAERRAAEFILEHPQDVIHLPITALAEQAGVSDATVFRLCRRLGFSGYQALKIALAREVETTPTAIFEAVADTDSPLTVAQKVFQSSVQSLTDTQRLLSGQTLEAAVRALATARRVEFYGVGGSGAVAVDAMHKFMRTGLHCAAHADSHLQMMGASLLEPGDVAVGISHSGNSKDVVEALQVARGAGATTIAITNQAGTPPAGC